MRETLPPAFAPRPRGAALALALVVWIGATVVVSALLAPAVHGLVEAIAPGRFPFRRVARRLAMLVAVVGFVAVGRRLGIRSFADVGLALSRDRLRAALAAAAIGAGVVVAMLGAELAAGARVAGGALTPVDALEALVGAVLIGLVEEGLLRGALLFPFGRLRGAALWAANAAISAVYATAHFARGGARVATVDAAAAWRMWAELPGAAAQHGEAWLGLFLTGALFYVVAWRQGHAWGAAGLHAGAVLALQWGGGLTEAAPESRSLLLVHGLLPGYGVAAAAAVAILVLTLTRDRSRSSTAPGPTSTAR
jgi:hypothetical protein